MSLPYCRERSIEFLSDYVENWIRIIDMLNHIIDEHPKDKPYDISISYLPRMVLDMTIVEQSIKDLYR